MIERDVKCPECGESHRMTIFALAKPENYIGGTSFYAAARSRAHNQFFGIILAVEDRVDAVVQAIKATDVNSEPFDLEVLEISKTSPLLFFDVFESVAKDLNKEILDLQKKIYSGEISNTVLKDQFQKILREVFGALNISSFHLLPDNMLLRCVNMVSKEKVSEENKKRWLDRIKSVWSTSFKDADIGFIIHEFLWGMHIVLGLGPIAEKPR